MLSMKGTFHLLSKRLTQRKDWLSISCRENKKLRRYKCLKNGRLFPNNLKSSFSSKEAWNPYRHHARMGDCGRAPCDAAGLMKERATRQNPIHSEITKRLSLPSSAFCNSTSDDYVKLEKEANEQRMEHIPIDRENDCNSEMSSDKFCRKSEISICRHSCAHPQENTDSKLLQRRRVTMHNLMMQRSIENEIQTLIRL